MFEQHCSFKNNLFSRTMIQFYISFSMGYVFLSSQLTAILENGRHGRQGAVRRWLHLQICSLYIGIPLCQNRCFYQKMHNRFEYPR